MANTAAGANIWRQGADTCVLNRAVGCTDNNAVKREDLDGYLSRIVPADSDDAATEKILAEWYPDLIQKGLMAVSKYQCTPKFLEQNLKISKNFNDVDTGPCVEFSARIIVNKEDPSFYTNLITKKYDMTFAEYMKKNRDLPLAERFLILRGVINAVVEMTNDKFPEWVIHSDIHGKNILYDAKKDTTALSDFGRVILIDDIDDPASVYEALSKYLTMIRKKVKDYTFDHEDASDTEYNCHIFMQSYEVYMKTKNPTVLEQAKAKLKDVENSLRVWGIQQILDSTSLRKGLDKEDISTLKYFYDGFQYITSSEKLIEYINDFMKENFREKYDLFEDDYIELDSFKMSGGGRKKQKRIYKTRKQKKKQRRTRKQ